ncbi:MAG: aminotransferase class I/II-fold pyridoxal phosphate-dependent enzyme [Spirochaetaceae bacterium]|jgi:O-acetylhomoserine (thiol)-lyase|nr:aminotransferase class I/II-fold pyridoxal phosphate-dependent enzyme [Spirochaetaceae bacterium]
MKGKASKLIHGNLTHYSHGSLKPPVYVTSAFDFPDSQSMEDAFQGRSGAHGYSRITNPTVSELQERLRILAGAEQCLCLSSGMAAMTAVLTALLSSGDRVLSSPWLFGNTLSLLNNTMKPYGIETDFVDLRDLQAVENAITPDTRCLLVEVLSNPQLILHDMAGLSQICQKHGIVLVVDNSLLTPYLFQGKDFQVDVEVLSTTKFISGGGTSVGGAVLYYPSEKWKKIPKLVDAHKAAGPLALAQKVFTEVYRNQGGCMSPQTASLQLQGLETLALRVERTQENALKMAEFLKAQSRVSRVLFPGLADYPQANLLQPILQGNTGQMILFDLSDQQECYSFMDWLKMIRRATNFCDNKSLIIHPASTIFSSSDDAQLKAMGFGRNSLRFSVGIEDVEDIMEDMEQAFKGL